MNTKMWPFGTTRGEIAMDDCDGVFRLAIYKATKLNQQHVTHQIDVYQISMTVTGICLKPV